MIGIPKPQDPSALRPISLSSIIARVAERMVNLRLVHVSERYTPAWQAGFRPRRNTDEQIATMAQRVPDSRRWRSKSAALFTDFSSAYDRVSIAALLYKLCAVQADPALLDG